MAAQSSTARKEAYGWRRWLDHLSESPSSTNPAIQSRYVDMLLETERIPILHNLIASSCTWLLLAGFLVFPGTFSTLQDTALADGLKGRRRDNGVISDAIQNPPLLGIAVASCALGTAGCGWLWWRWRSNLIWPTRQIFLPTLVHSVTGLVNTFLNVYTARHRTWSVMAIATAVVTGAFAVAATILLGIIQLVALQQIKYEHQVAVAKYAIPDYIHTHGICECSDKRPGAVTPDK
ncbi:hypothetical protein ASPBRDRAFT_139881 [Aspergillus brasiliensis CBS 101740]|uniref:Uncharacterized protein n=1 Tax=Aspergillus brasiliensis (strain CBS 101740 / IMI 381727 / IBT 21946) TaxID=767769 RepID=A0A1L9U1I8_ASPBC|nr:hypothetical protein ASPBRDRAFT_139881 [Aspergillus brasiliensis CBS 101740]